MRNGSKCTLPETVVAGGLRTREGPTRAKGATLQGARVLHVGVPNLDRRGTSGGGGMLRLTLLRLPRLPAARSPPRAAYAVIHAYTAPQESRRYASSFPNSPADPLKPAESTSTTSEDTSSQAQTADTKETEKLGDNTIFYIPPNVESSKEHDPKDSQVEPEKPDGVRGTSGSQPSQPIGAVNIDELKEKLRVWSENAAITIRKRADQYTSSAITTFAQLGRELNKVTGYGEIESLKRQVAEQGPSASLYLYMCLTSAYRGSNKVVEAGGARGEAGARESSPATGKIATRG